MGRGSKRRRQNGSWELRVYSRERGGHLHRTVKAATEAEAEVALVEFWLQVQKGQVLPTQYSRLDDYLDGWLESHALKVRETTFRGYEGVVRNYLKRHLGHLTLGELKPIHIQKMYDAMLTAGLSATTVAMVHRVLHKALRQAVSFDLIAANPTDRVQPPSKAHFEYAQVTIDQLAAVLDYVRETRWDPVFQLLIMTGMRRSELVGLRWQDVDLDGGTITIRQGLNDIPGKGLVARATKSGKPRSLALAAETIDTLHRHAISQKLDKLRVGPLWQENGLVFTREDGRPIRPDTLSSRWKRMREDLGFPDSFRLHDLRGAHATWAIALGFDVKTVQNRLGHSTAQITLDIYARAVPKLDRDLAEGFAKVVGNVGKNLGKEA